MKPMNDNSSSSKTTIYHYTAPFYVSEIIESGRIELELHKYFVELEIAANDNIREAKDMMKSYKYAGRYVWFTTAANSPSAGPFSTVRFKFCAEDIGAERWDVCRRKRIQKMGGRAFDEISALERAAIRSGEDPSNWWVCSDAVLIDSSHFDGDYRRPSPKIDPSECMTWSDQIKLWRRNELRRRLGIVNFAA